MEKNTFNRQQGFVSIFSVLFFTLLAAVITIGFVRLMVIEQQQALDNDSTSRALSAAEAGVEDAKRAIDYYAKLGGGAEKDAIRAALASDKCDALFTNTSDVAKSIGLVGKNGVLADGQNLRYTCLNVALNTADYTKPIAANTSQVIALRGETDFNQLTVEWHKISNGSGGKDSDGVPANYPLAGDLPRISDFGKDGAQPPAFMRLQLIGVPKGSFNRGDLEARSRIVFLSPQAPGGASETDFTAADNRGFNSVKSSPIGTKCVATAQAKDNEGKYACAFTLTLPGGSLDTKNNNYYLQLTPLYRSTNIRVQLKQKNISDPSAASSIVKFNEVQPSIDSTGAAADVFRRVEARVELPDETYATLRYAAEVGDNICKNFYVTNDPAQWQANQCTAP